MDLNSFYIALMSSMMISLNKSVYGVWKNSAADTNNKFHLYEPKSEN